MDCIAIDKHGNICIEFDSIYMSPESKVIIQQLTTTDIPFGILCEFMNIENKFLRLIEDYMCGKLSIDKDQVIDELTSASTQLIRIITKAKVPYTSYHNKLIDNVKQNQSIKHAMCKVHKTKTNNNITLINTTKTNSYTRNIRIS